MSRRIHNARSRRAAESIGGDDARRPGEPGGDGPLSSERELWLLQRLMAFNARFRGGREAEKALRAGLRLGLDLFGASEGCIAAAAPGNDSAEISFCLPRGAAWDLGELGRYIAGEKAKIPRNTMLARIRRRGRMWGVLAVRTEGLEYGSDARRALSTIASTMTNVIERIDQERIREVRARIDRKILEQVRPKDLFYQILHGIRSLTDYDHSASLLICNAGADALEVVAEQIAWRKGKSRSVGLRLPLAREIRELLKRETVYGFTRENGAWREWDDRPAGAVAELLDFDAEAPEVSPGELAPPETAILAAPLVGRDGILGVLKVAARSRGVFGPYEAELVSRFLPQVSVALQIAQRADALEAKMVASERRTAMAHLARGVSHDVNNALGAVLPLVEELRADALDGSIDAATAAEDLRQVKRSLDICRRIFGGMLTFARRGARSTGEVSLRGEIDETLGALHGAFERRSIDVVLDVPPDLPPLRAVPADIEQLLLNFLTNARDAMPQGGTLTIRARLDAGVDRAMIEIVITDTGHGIPATELDKVQEAFFTTKDEGHGLGLAICRSIVSQMRGRTHIESVPDRGTRVELRLPAVEDSPR